MNIDGVFVEKVLEAIPHWIQIIRNKGEKITPKEAYLLKKIQYEVENALAEYKTGSEE